MLFKPQKVTLTGGSCIVPANVAATAHESFTSPIFKEFWAGFTFGWSSIEIAATDEYIFRIGEAESLSAQGFEYSINVESGGICVTADSREALARGFMTLLDRMKPLDDNTIEIECCRIFDSPAIGRRSVHFCIFPETDLWELHRFVRFCGALRYTHIVLEFWGMLKYDCLEELAWSHAFTKDQIRPIIQEARDLGMEVIPMFNHWGHAAACRVMHGKHVVLDQNPSLQSLFSEDGWCWNIKSPRVRALHRQIRHELMELCGPGEYFHVGCDEAYHFVMDKENMDLICGFLNEISAELREEGRRMIAWGDMMLFKLPHFNSDNKYICFATSAEASEYMIANLDKNIIIADWQYWMAKTPVETALIFKEAGFECWLCPWDRGCPSIDACIDTIRDHALPGFMHTTWHTLSSGMPFVSYAAISGCEKEKTLYSNTRTAALLRKVYHVKGDFEKAGWSKKEINSIT